jgi:hypothetical protein
LLCCCCQVSAVLRVQPFCPCLVDIDRSSCIKLVNQKAIIYQYLPWGSLAESYLCSEQPIIMYIVQYMFHLFPAYVYWW